MEEEMKDEMKDEMKEEMEEEMKEEKEPIESYRLVTRPKNNESPFVTNVKFRPDIEKKLKKLFSDALIYLESANYNKEIYEALKKILSLDFNDVNNTFRLFQNGFMIRSNVPPTKSLYLDFFNSGYRSHYYETTIEIEINCYVGGAGVFDGYYSYGVTRFFKWPKVN